MVGKVWEHSEKIKLARSFEGFSSAHFELLLLKLWSVKFGSILKKFKLARSNLRALSKAFPMEISCKFYY